MQRSMRSGRLLVAAVAIALASVWLVPQVRVDENRVPPTVTSTSLAGVNDATLFREVDAVLADRVPIKGSVVHRTADLVVAAGLSPRSIVWRGEGSVPFYAGDFTFPCAETAGAAAAMPRIRELADRLEESGVPLLFAIVPDKSSVLRDQLGPAADALMECSDPVRRSWERVDDPSVLVAWSEFDTARDRGDELYFSGDTHWNWHGAALFSQLVLARLAERGVAPAGIDLSADLRDAGEVEHPDDLFLLMGVERTEPAEQLVTLRHGVTTTHEQLEHGSRWISTDDGSGSPLIPGRTLVLRDSMFDYNGDLLAPYFEDLTAVWSADFATSGVNLADFDLVIIQQVQRSVPTYLDDVLVAAG